VSVSEGLHKCERPLTGGADVPYQFSSAGTNKIYVHCLPTLLQLGYRERAIRQMIAAAPIRGGARTSRQPGHFQVSKVVGRVIRPHGYM